MMKQLKLLAHQVGTVALDLVFPPYCVGCGRVGSFLCIHCISTIGNGPDRCIDGLDDVNVLTQYDGVIRKAVHAFKYDGVRRLADPLSGLLAGLLAREGWQIDLVCAVPLHSSRKAERGYNQAALLAERVATQLGWHFTEDALIRIRETESQIHLTAKERERNVAGAFAAVRHLVEGQRVLVIDDVLTTGATLGACAHALRQAGAPQVFGAALASAVLGSDAVAGVLGMLA